MEEYFSSYESFDVHHLMLRDNRRVLAYKNAIFDCKNEIKDKIVMDVGAGTGILSIFCAQAGAKKVYAIEASDFANIAKNVIAENQFGDCIEVIQKKVEDLDATDIKEEHIDVIVSEWMGFYLVHEGMLDSVLIAKDKFLKKGGLMFPNEAQIFVAPCQVPSLFQFYDDVFGVKMKCLGAEHRKTCSSKPEVLTVAEEDILAEKKVLVYLNLEEPDINSKDLDLLGGQEIAMPCKRDGLYQGMCLWFSVKFPNGSELNSGPYEEETHWKQTVVVFQDEMKVEKNEPIAFKVTLERNKDNFRRYNILFEMLEPDEVDHEIPCDCCYAKCKITKAFIEQTENQMDVKEILD